MINLFAINDIDWTDVWGPIKDLLNSVGPYLVGAIIAFTVIWGMYVGSKYWAAGDDEERLKKAKLLLKNTILGVLIGAVLIVALPLMITALVTWMGPNPNLKPPA